MMYAIASLLMCFLAFGQEFIKFTNGKETRRGGLALEVGTSAGICQ
ncbi:hypothetical protein [Nostoc sp. KVJ20]|nr:hypothetical protein [Nostoc sp. KVJ20]